MYINIEGCTSMRAIFFFLHRVMNLWLFFFKIYYHLYWHDYNVQDIICDIVLESIKHLEVSTLGNKLIQMIIDQWRSWSVSGNWNRKWKLTHFVLFGTLLKSHCWYLSIAFALSDRVTWKKPEWEAKLTLKMSLMKP